jgi:predicted ester cyclase
MRDVDDKEVLLSNVREYNFRQDVPRGGSMRKSTTFCLLFIVCTTLTLAVAQKKPRQQERAQEATQSKGQNEALARRVFDLANQGGSGGVDQVFDRNCKVHFGGRTVSLSQAVAEGRGWKTAAPDMAMNVENVTENGDKVTVFWSARGTHTGPGLGVAPTRRQVSVHDRSQFLIKNGKIVEVWNPEYRDELSRQLKIPKNQISMLETGLTALGFVADLFHDPLYASLK